MLGFNLKSLDNFALIPENYLQTITCISLDTLGDATTRTPQKSKPTSLKQSPIPEEDATLQPMNYFFSHLPESTKQEISYLIVTSSSHS